MPSHSLRVVTFNFHPAGYKVIRDWILASNHKHILAVTTPGPKSRPTPSYRQVVDASPRDVDVLITTRLRKVATPLIRELKPDLIACLSFPYRIPPELCAIPSFGAVNIHPAVLPAYRGPNIMRPFFDGAPVYGATAHWIAEEYDTGNILSQKMAPMPAQVDENTMSRWFQLISETCAEGMERAIEGNPGIPQDHTKATYAAPFSEEEHWLDWNEPQQVLQRKFAALNLFDSNPVIAKINKTMIQVKSLVLLPDHKSSEEPGTIVEESNKTLVVQVADGCVRVEVELLDT